MRVITRWLQSHIGLKVTWSHGREIVRLSRGTWKQLLIYIYEKFARWWTQIKYRDNSLVCRILTSWAKNNECSSKARDKGQSNLSFGQSTPLKERIVPKVMTAFSRAMLLRTNVLAVHIHLVPNESQIMVLSVLDFQLNEKPRNQTKLSCLFFMSAINIKSK